MDRRRSVCGASRPRPGVRSPGGAMTFAQIPANVALFIDSNILVYYFAPNAVFGAACQVVMDRISKYQDFMAYTSTLVLSELAHQLMILEAAQQFGWPLAGI